MYRVRAESFCKRNLQLSHASVFRCDSSLRRSAARRPGDVSERSVPAAAKGDGAPDSEDPALIKKMRNQHTKPGRVMPVRAHHGCRAVP